MRTDQLPERLWLSAKLGLLRIKWQVIRTVQLLGLAGVGVGGFLYFRRHVMDLQQFGPTLAELPAIYFVQDELGNVVILFAGLIVVALGDRI